MRVLLAFLLSSGLAAETVDFGFSSRPLVSPVPFEGILGGESGQASLTIPVAPGERGVTHVFANIVSALPLGHGISAWRLAIQAEGLGVILSATGNGTAAERAIADGFHQVEVVDFATGIPRYGVVAVATLPTSMPTTLPSTGTQSVLDLEIMGFGTPNDDCRLRFHDGLYWRNPEWGNQVTVSGGPEPESPPIGNLASIELQLLFVPGPAAPFVRADANGDGDLDISDAIWTLMALFAGGPAPQCEDAADANDDGRLDLADAIYLLGFLFLGEEAPPAPHPACGDDPGVDDLDCGQTPSSCS